MKELMSAVGKSVKGNGVAGLAVGAVVCAIGLAIDLVTGTIRTASNLKKSVTETEDKSE